MYWAQSGHEKGHAANVRNWAGSRLAGSLRGQMNSCRLGRSGRLAVAANIAAVRS